MVLQAFCEENTLLTPKHRKGSCVGKMSEIDAGQGIQGTGFPDFNGHREHAENEAHSHGTGLGPA